MLLKATAQLLGAAKRVWVNRWEIPKGYLIASGQFLKGTENPLGNAQIPAISQ
jgi:hypothetical protein